MAKPIRGSVPGEVGTPTGKRTMIATKGLMSAAIHLAVVVLLLASAADAKAADTPRPLRYLPDGHSFVIVNGKNHFNRPLYGNRTASFIYASEVPEIMLSLPGKGGTLWFGVVSPKGSKWLHEADNVIARYRPGAMQYEVRDELLGAGTLTIDVLPMTNRDGALLRMRGSQNLANVEFYWSFGGASGFDNNKWDFDTAKYCPESATLFQPKDCAEHDYKITEAGFELRAPCYGLQTEIRADTPGSLTSVDISTVRKKMRPVIGVTPPGCELKITDAEAVRSPAVLWESSAGDLPLVAGRITLESDKPLLFALERPADGDTPIARANLPAAIEEAEKQRSIIASRVRVSTPDPFLNAAVPAISVAADRLWTPPVYMHGAVAWRMPLLGWRGAYIASEFGWHDRAKAHFREYARLQFQERGGGTAHAEPKYNLARQSLDSVLYSRGHIPNAPVKGEMGQCDMQQVYVDQLLWHLQWTGDLDFASEMWPVLVEHFAWEKRCFDPDDDGLYENFANTMISDAHHYSGSACTQSSAYNYRSLKLVAELAKHLGEDAEPFEREAAKTLAAMKRTLWMPKHGWYADYRDLLGLKRLHPAAELPTVYHAIDSDVPDMFEARQLLRYVDTSIQHVPIDDHSEVLWTSNWAPYIWSVRNVIPSETAHMALAYWQAGEREAAWKLFRGAMLDSMYASRVPGNCAGTSELDPRQTGAATDFNCTVGMYGRALVEGLFGVVPNLIHDELLIRPGLPPEWESASIDTPDIGYTYSRKGDTERFEIRSRLKQTTSLRLRLVAFKTRVARVRVNGKEVDWENGPAVGEPIIEIVAEKADGADIEITWEGEKRASVECHDVFGQGEPIVADFGPARVVEVNDPQQLLKNLRHEGSKLRGTVVGQFGHRTVFAKIAQGDLSWWSPVQVEVRPPLEIIESKWDHSAGEVQFAVRNNTGRAVAEQSIVHCGSAQETVDLQVPPHSQSANIRISAEDLVPGTNPIVVELASGDNLRGNVVDWHGTDGKQQLAFECVDLNKFFNERVSQIFNHEYKSPRSPNCSLQIPLHAFGDWCYGGANTPQIDDSALRNAAGDAGRFNSEQGVPLATPGPGDSANVIFTSLWDNFPDAVNIPLQGRAKHVWLLVAGSTHPMQSQLDNGEIVVAYTDGSSERLPLRNPTNWWPIEQDYDLNADSYCIPGPYPPRIELGVGRATLLDLPLDPERELRSLTVTSLANDVVVGLLSATLLRPE